MTEGKQISRTEYVTPKTVPKMSLPTKMISRLPKIKQGLQRGLNRNEIAVSCQVDEKTIDRDMKTWTETGFFEQWLKEEFLRLHVIVEEDDAVEAYKQIGNLVKATMTRKIEQRNEQVGPIKLICSWKNKYATLESLPAQQDIKDSQAKSEVRTNDSQS